MAKKDDKGNWVDGLGRSVPGIYVPAIDKKRDKLVSGLVQEAAKMSAQLEAFRTKTLDSIQEYIAWALKHEGVDLSTLEGNKMLTDFSAATRVELKVGKMIDFDERLLMAKALVMECLDEWGAGADDKLQLIVGAAFRKNEKGKVNRDLLTSLITYQVKGGPKWNKAMKLIRDSMHVVASKDYVKFAHKDRDGQWQGICLDIARFSRPEDKQSTPTK